jgi:hypothetical protein
MSEIVWAVVIVAVCGGLFFLASRLEPHWVAKDGSRFLTTAEPIDRFGNPAGRRREVRVAVLPDGGLMVSRRSLQRSTSSVWRIQHKSPKADRGRVIYLLRPVPADPEGEMLGLRVPQTSRIVATLDALVPAPGGGDPGQRSET